MTSQWEERISINLVRVWFNVEDPWWQNARQGLRTIQRIRTIQRRKKFRTVLKWSTSRRNLRTNVGSRTELWSFRYSHATSSSLLLIRVHVLVLESQPNQGPDAASTRGHSQHQNCFLIPSSISFNFLVKIVSSLIIKSKREKIFWRNYIELLNHWQAGR